MISLDRRNVIWAVILIIIGVLFSMFCHLFGNGSVLLPMHIPVMLAGFLLLWPYAIAVAIIIPLLSNIFSGTPQLFYLLYMIPEFITYTLLTNILFRKNYGAPFLKNVFVTLGIAIIVGRLISSLFQAIFIVNNQGIIEFFDVRISNGANSSFSKTILYKAIIHVLIIMLGCKFKIVLL